MSRGDLSSPAHNRTPHCHSPAQRAASDLALESAGIAPSRPEKMPAGPPPHRKREDPRASESDPFAEPDNFKDPNDEPENPDRQLGPPILGERDPRLPNQPGGSQQPTPRPGPTPPPAPPTDPKDRDLWQKGGGLIMPGAVAAAGDIYGLTTGAGAANAYMGRHSLRPNRRDRHRCHWRFLVAHLIPQMKRFTRRTLKKPTSSRTSRPALSVRDRV